MSSMVGGKHAAIWRRMKETEKRTTIPPSPRKPHSTTTTTKTETATLSSPPPVISPAVTFDDEEVEGVEGDAGESNVVDGTNDHAQQPQQNNDEDDNALVVDEEYSSDDGDLNYSIDDTATKSPTQHQLAFLNASLLNDLPPFDDLENTPLSLQSPNANANGNTSFESDNNDFNQGIAHPAVVDPELLRLRERLATLVKEIRFADQTCVELSYENKMLEQAAAQQTAALESELARVQRELERCQTRHQAELQLQEQVMAKLKQNVEEGRRELQQRKRQKEDTEEEIAMLREELENARRKEEEQKQEKEQLVSKLQQELEATKEELEELQETKNQMVLELQEEVERIKEQHHQQRHQQIDADGAAAADAADRRMDPEEQQLLQRPLESITGLVYEGEEKSRKRLMPDGLTPSNSQLVGEGEIEISNAQTLLNQQKSRIAELEKTVDELQSENTVLKERGVPEREEPEEEHEKKNRERLMPDGLTPTKAGRRTEGAFASAAEMLATEDLLDRYKACVSELQDQVDHLENENTVLKEQQRQAMSMVQTKLSNSTLWMQQQFEAKAEAQQSRLEALTKTLQYLRTNLEFDDVSWQSDPPEPPVEAAPSPIALEPMGAGLGYDRHMINGIDDLALDRGLDNTGNMEAMEQGEQQHQQPQKLAGGDETVTQLQNKVQAYKLQLEQAEMTMATLTRRVEGTQAEMALVEKENSRFKQASVDLGAKLEQLRGELSEQQAQTEDAENQYSQTQQQLLNLQTQNQDLSVSEKQLQDANSKLQIKISVLQTELNEKMTYLQDQSEQLRQVEKAKKKLETKAQTLQTQLDSTKLTRDGLDEAKRNLEAKLQTTQAELQAVKRKDSQELKKNVSELTQKIHTLEVSNQMLHNTKRLLDTELDGVRAQLDRNETYLEMKQDEAAELEEANEKLDSANKSLRIKLDLANEQIQHLNPSLQQAQETLSKVQAKNAILVKSLEETTSALESLTKERSQLTKELEEQQRMGTEQMDQYEQTLERFKNNKAELQSEIEQMKTSLLESAQEKARMQQELDNALALYKQMEANVAEYSTKTDDFKLELNQQLHHSAELLAEVRQERDVLKNELAVLSATVEQTEQKLRSSTAETEALKATRQDDLRKQAELADEGRAIALAGDTKIEEMKRKLQASLAENERIQSDFSTANQKVAALMEEVKLKQQKLDEVESKLGAMEKHLAETLSQKEQISVDFVVANEKLASMANELQSQQAQVGQLESKLAATAKILSETQALCGVRTEELGVSKKSLEGALTENAAAKQRIAALETENRDKNLQYEMVRRDLETAVERAQATTVELEELKGKMEERLAERQQVLRDLQSYSAETHREWHKQLQDEKEAHKTNLASLQATLDDVVRNMESKVVAARDELLRVGVDISTISSHGGTLSFAVDRANMALTNLHECFVLAGETIANQTSSIAELSTSNDENARKLADEMQRTGELEHDIETEKKVVADLKIEAIKSEGQLQTTVSKLHDAVHELQQCQNALSILQKQLAEKSDYNERLLAEREEADRKTVFLAGRLEQSTVELNEVKQELEEAEALLLEHEGVAERLQAQNDSLEQKCARLREYIERLTVKCEQWSESYTRQSELLESLRDV